MGVLAALKGTLEMYAMSFIGSLNEWKVLSTFCSLGARDAKCPIMNGQELSCTKCLWWPLVNFGEGIWEHRPSVLKKHKGRRIPQCLREISSQLGRVKREEREEEGEK